MFQRRRFLLRRPARGGWNHHPRTARRARGWGGLFVADCQHPQSV